MSTEINSTWQELPPVLARKSCTNCHGTGWELFVLDGYSKARRCVCRSLDQLEKLRQHVRIPQRYEHCLLALFVPQNLSQTRALVEAHRFAERYPEVSRGLFFSGPPGVGKTHLAVAVARDLLLRFHDDILFVDFAGVLRSGLYHLGRSQAAETNWERLKKVSLLLVDDFGWRSPKREGILILEELLHARWFMKKLTVFTGDSVSCRGLFVGRGRHAASSSSTQILLSSLSAQTMMRILTQVKMIPMRGDDYRRRRAEEGMLF